MINFDRQSKPEVDASTLRATGDLILTRELGAARSVEAKETSCPNFFEQQPYVTSTLRANRGSKANSGFTGRSKGRGISG